MKGWDWFLSLAIHGAVIGAATLGLLRVPSAQDTGPVPIYFEVIEASAIESDSGSVPNDMPNDVGPVPINVGSVPMNAGSVPNDGEMELGGNFGYFDEKCEIGVCETMGVSQSDESASAEEEDNARVEGEEAQRVTEVGEMSSVDPVGRSEESEKGEPLKTEREPLAVEREPLAVEREPLVAEQEERAKVVSDPMAINRIVPVYPRWARRKGHEGDVTVEVSVAEDGGIAHAAVVTSSGYAELDEAALAAVRSARFTPASEDGVSVRGELRLTFAFRLK